MAISEPFSCFFVTSYSQSTPFCTFRHTSRDNRGDGAAYLMHSSRWPDAFTSAARWVSAMAMLLRAVAKLGARPRHRS